MLEGGDLLKEVQRPSISTQQAPENTLFLSALPSVEFTVGPQVCIENDNPKMRFL